MKIYCVKPISGCSGDEVFEYYDNIRKILLGIGYDVLTPLYGKGKLRTEVEFKAHGYQNDPLTTNHAIFGRDKFFVQQSDILFANFIGADRVSIGSVMEIAMGHIFGKQIVVVMEKDNIHRHAFVLEASTIVFENEDDAIKYLKEIQNQEF